MVLSMTPSGRYYVSFQVEQPLRVVGSAENYATSADLNTKTCNFFNGKRWSHTRLPRPMLSAMSRLRTAQKPSKLCCICRQKNAGRKLQEHWTCSNCGTEQQRDENAVVNLFVERLRSLAEGRSVSACGGTL